MSFHSSRVRSSSGNTLDLAMKSHYFHYIDLYLQFCHLLILINTVCIRACIYTLNRPASRQEHFPTSTHSLYKIQYLDESDLEPQPKQMDEGALLAHHRWPATSTASYDKLVRSALGLGCGYCTKSMYEIWHDEHAVWKRLRSREALLPSVVMAMV